MSEVNTFMDGWTWEVLEAVLLHCDGCSLLQCRLVCRRWCRVVDALINGPARQLSMCAGREMSPRLLQQLNWAFGGGKSRDAGCLYRAWRRHALLADWQSSVKEWQHTHIYGSGAPTAVVRLLARCVLISCVRDTLVLSVDDRSFAPVALPARLTNITYLSAAPLHCTAAGAVSGSWTVLIAATADSGEIVVHVVGVQMRRRFSVDWSCHERLPLLSEQVLSVTAADRCVCVLDARVVRVFSISVIAEDTESSPSTLLHCRCVLTAPVSSTVAPVVVWPAMVTDECGVFVYLSRDGRLVWQRLTCATNDQRKPAQAMWHEMATAGGDALAIDGRHVLDMCEFDGTAVVSLGSELFVGVHGGEDERQCVVHELFDWLQSRITCCRLYTDLLAVGSETGHLVVFHVRPCVLLHSPVKHWRRVISLNVAAPVVDVQFVEERSAVRAFVTTRRSVQCVIWQRSSSGL